MLAVSPAKIQKYWWFFPHFPDFLHKLAMKAAPPIPKCQYWGVPVHLQFRFSEFPIVLP